jgi:predicted enzyme related to lactoylglutathione lyase
MPDSTPFVWHEVNTPRTEESIGFYTNLFGWESKEIPLPGAPGMKYMMFTRDEQPVAGIVPMIGEAWKGLRSHWAVYIAVDDVDHMVTKAVSLGAKVLVPAFDIDQVCRMSLICDPQGAAFYLYKSYQGTGAS